MNKTKLLGNLFFTMMKIGLFTFGGGIAMLALLENEFVSKKEWLEREEFLDMTAIAESTPGPIAINSATYIGYKTAGFVGSLVATLAVCIPSFVILYAISLFFNTFLSWTYVAYAFKGIRVAVIFLILSAGVKLFKGVKKQPMPLLILSATFLTMLLTAFFAISFSSIFYVLISGAVGVFVYLCLTLKKKREGESE